MNQPTETPKERSYMRTSGGGDRDLSMLTVPLAVLAYGLSSGGGVVSVLRTMERTLWIVVGWVGNFISQSVAAFGGRHLEIFEVNMSQGSVGVDDLLARHVDVQRCKALQLSRACAASCSREHHSYHPRPQVVHSRPGDSGIRARAGALHDGPANRRARAHLLASFGPKLFSFRRGDTEYCVSAIPLGGYVKMAGENPKDGRTGASDEFLSKSKWQRFQVLVMGPVMNLALALIVMAFVLYHNGADVPAFAQEPVIVGSVVADSPAAKAGIQPGDHITEVAGVRVDNWETSAVETSTKANRPITLTIVRNGKTIEQEIVPVGEANTKRASPASSRSCVRRLSASCRDSRPRNPVSAPETRSCRSTDRSRW